MLRRLPPSTNRLSAWKSPSAATARSFCVAMLNITAWPSIRARRESCTTWAWKSRTATRWMRPGRHWRSAASQPHERAYDEPGHGEALCYLDADGNRIELYEGMRRLEQPLQPREIRPLRFGHITLQSIELKRAAALLYRRAWLSRVGHCRRCRDMAAL